MNTPYELTDVFKEIVETTRHDLELDVLNYQFGDLDELQETLKQMSETEEFEVKKYPLVWLVQPFTIDRNIPVSAGFGDALLRIFIFTNSDVNLKARERMELKFKAILNPIYYKLLENVNIHEAISYESAYRSHQKIDRYKIEEVVDLCDCIDINKFSVRINNNTKC